MDRTRGEDAYLNVREENFSLHCVKPELLYTYCMKILILFIFFASLFYYLKPADRPVVVDLDEIKVKLSAPERVKRTHRHVAPAQRVDSGDSERVVVEVAKELEEANLNIEQDWEGSLKARLIELDPAVGEEIFTLYQEEKDSYARRLERIVKEHQESEDLDYLIDELDHSHQQRLQDIFGPYFEDLRDLQTPVTQ